MIQPFATDVALHETKICVINFLAGYLKDDFYNTRIDYVLELGYNDFYIDGSDGKRTRGFNIEKHLNIKNIDIKQFNIKNYNGIYLAVE